MFSVWNVTEGQWLWPGKPSDELRGSLLGGGMTSNLAPVASTSRKHLLVQRPAAAAEDGRGSSR